MKHIQDNYTYLALAALSLLAGLALYTKIIIRPVLRALA